MTQTAVDIKETDEGIFQAALQARHFAVTTLDCEGGVRLSATRAGMPSISARFPRAGSCGAPSIKIQPVAECARPFVTDDPAGVLRALDSLARLRDVE